MKTHEGFILFENSEEFSTWLKKEKINRNIKIIQQHHTFRPNYLLFKDDNHFQLQQGMKNYHTLPQEKGGRGWVDIAQHLTTFPDGKICTGRSFNIDPAGIKGKNKGAICIEHIGNFDDCCDDMSEIHKKTIIELNAALCIHFKIPVNTDNIIYHTWFASWKSCPGTNFFGGNTVEDCNNYFIPLIKSAI